MGGFYQPQSYHPYFGFQPVALFQGESAYDLISRAVRSPAAYVPRTVQGLPPRPTQPAPAVTPPTPAKSRKPVTAKAPPAVTVTGHKCAAKGCKNKVTGKAVYCGATCRKREQRRRDKENGTVR